MKKYIKKAGLLLFSIGILILVINYIAGWSHINSLQLTALAMIIAGAACTVTAIKKDSEY